jgi:hypothetical protein
MCRVNKALDRESVSNRGLIRARCAGFAPRRPAACSDSPPSKQAMLSPWRARNACGINTWRQDPEHIDKGLVLFGAPARATCHRCADGTGRFTCDLDRI